MRKILFFAVLTLVAVLLAAPWFFGGFTERRVEQRLMAGPDADPGIAIITEEYRRHWFSSDSRHRLVITDPTLAEAIDELTGGDTFGDQPALIVETRIEHGPLPLTDEDDAPIAPGLSRAVSTFSLDPGNRSAPVSLPGRLVTTMALDGTTRADFTLEAGTGELAGGEGRIEWEGARAEALIAADGRGIRSRGRIDPIRLDGPSDPAGSQPQIVLGTVEFESDQHYTRHGWPIGPVALSIASLTIDDGITGIDVSGIRITSDSEITGDLLSGVTEIDVGRLQGGDSEPASLEADLAVSNIHAESLAALTRFARELEGTDTAADLFPEMEPDLARLITAGPVIDLRALVVSLPDGDLRLTGYLAMAAGGDPMGPIVATELVDRLTANLELRVPASLVGSVGAGVPRFTDELQMLIAMGVLREDGDDYRMEAEYGNRLLTVNGLPVPIPFGM